MKVISVLKNIENSKWIIDLNVFVRQIQNCVEDCGYLTFLWKWAVTKTRCITLCLPLLWSMRSLNMSKCSPYVWQLHWPLLLKHCQGECVPRSANVRKYSTLHTVSITALKKRRYRSTTVACLNTDKIKVATDWNQSLPAKGIFMYSIMMHWYIGKNSCC